MKHSESMRVGVVVERRKIDHPWQEYSWRAVEVVPGAAPSRDWRVLVEGDGRTRYLAGTLNIELFAKETDAYRHNLTQRAPTVFVVLRRDDGSDERPYTALSVTVSPDEAQEYLDGGDDLVEAVPMPAAVAAWMRDYIARHHVDVPFQKRRRRPPDGGKGADGAKDSERG